MRIITVYKSPLYSSIQFLCNLHKSVISFKSKLSPNCPNKIDHIVFSNHFAQTQRCIQNPAKHLRWSALQK